jgi:hypothetical protein
VVRGGALIVEAAAAASHLLFGSNTRTSTGFAVCIAESHGIGPMRWSEYSCRVLGGWMSQRTISGEMAGKRCLGERAC